MLDAERDDEHADDADADDKSPARQRSPEPEPEPVEDKKKSKGKKHRSKDGKSTQQAPLGRGGACAGGWRRRS
jgi:hypothetical protein